MYPHRIRLRGPWTCQPLYRRQPGDNQNLPSPFRLTMPARWRDGGLSDFRGAVRFTRPFGYPGRIDDFERVWLTFAGWTGRATVMLNNQPLGELPESGDAAEFEITPFLLPRNVLLVDLESTTPDGGLGGEVALEVRATAYLRGVSWTVAGGEVKAIGEVYGQAARPLDLYLLADGKSLAHSMVEPLPEGRPFELHGTAEAVPRAIKVELVDAATIWYVVEGNVAGQSKTPADSSYR